MADFGIPSVSELLPSDLVKQMRDQGGKKFLSKADELTKNALPAAAVLAGRQVPGADATARRVAALLERFGDEYLPEQLGLGSGGLTYTGDGYNVSASPSSIGIETGLLGGKLNMGVERTGSVKDMLNNLGFTARAKWEF
mgnify:CR=1 FL=1